MSDLELPYPPAPVGAWEEIEPFLEAQVEAGAYRREEPKPRWQPTTASQAEWAMRMLADARSALARVAALYDEQKRVLDQWANDATRKARAAVNVFEPMLEQYALTRRHATEKGAAPEITTYLPSGVVKTTKGRDKYVITDEAALIEWCEQNLGVVERALVVKVEKSVLTSQLAKVTKVVRLEDDDDGEDHVVVIYNDDEVVPGIEVVDAEVHAKVEVNPLAIKK